MIWAAFIICATLLYGGVIGYFSHMNQITGSWWILAVWFGGVLSPWVIISRYSDDLVLDSLYYDVAIIIGFCLAVCVCQERVPTAMQLVGVIVCLVGIAVFQAGS